MRLQHRGTIPRLEHSLSSILNGLTLREWAETKASGLLSVSNQTSPPLELELSSPLLQARRIKKIEYKRGLPEWGRLIIGNDGFVVELSPTRKYPAPWFRFNLAHEMAHTLFYNIESWPPLRTIYVEPGNRDLEWLCWLVARCLLIPADWLRRQIESYPKLGSKKFSIKVLYQLEQDFAVPWQIVAERLIQDLGLWNCILLKFTLSRNFSESFGEEKRFWHLNWQMIPVKGTDELFIPVGRRIEGKMKFPRAKGVLAKFLSNCIQSGEKEPFFSQSMNYKVLSTSTTGNLGKFLSEKLGSNEVRVFGERKIAPNKEMFNLVKKDRQPSVLLCFPLKSSRSGLTDEENSFMS